MQNKIILTTALKGGVGKSCLCANFATFFVEQGQPVMVLDADIQQSISRHRKRDLASHPSAMIPWQVLFLNTTDLEGVKVMINRVKKLPCTVLIDCPGNIQDPALRIIYEAADVAIIPYELNSDCVDATVMFAELFKKNFTAKMFFVPNKVSTIFEKRGEVRKAREDSIEALNRKFGEITPDIRLTTHLNGYSTLELFDSEKRKVLRDAFGDVPITRFFLFGSGAAKVISATEYFVMCDKLNQKVHPESIRELNLKGSGIDIWGINEEDGTLDSYQTGLVYFVKKGLDIKNCILCKFYKYNEWQNTHVCIRYKTLGEQYHFPKQTTARNCPLYEKDPVLMNHSIEELEKEVSEVSL